MRARLIAPTPGVYGATRPLDHWKAARWLAVPLGVALATRVIIWLVEYASLVLVPANASIPVQCINPRCLNVGVLIRWDALGYLDLARDGYWFDPITRLGSATFLPVYPLLISLVSRGLGQPNLAAVIVSNVAYVAAAVVFYRLTWQKTSLTVATRAGVFLGLFPYAFLFSTAYPQSLTLLWAVLALACAERQRWWPGAVFATLAALTQPVGLALVPALVVSRWGQRSGKAGGAQLLGELGLLALPVVALLGFAVYLRAGAGLSGQQVVATIAGAVPSVADAPARDALLWWLNLGLGFAALATAPRVFRRLGPAYAVYVVGVVVVAAAAHPAGLGSAVLLAFPSVIVVADWLRDDLAETLVIVLSAFPLALLAASFVNGYSIGGMAVAVPNESDPARILATYHRTIARQRSGVAPVSPDLLLSLDDRLLILGAEPPRPRYVPGELISVPLYLYVLRSTDKEYLISTRLRDARGQEVARRDRPFWGSADGNFRDPGAPAPLTDGNYVREDLVLPLDPAIPAGVYSIDVFVFELPSFARVPLLNRTGAPVDPITFADVIVASPRDLATVGRLVPSKPEHAVLGDGLELLGYDVDQSGAGGRVVNVSLYWQAQKQPERDYTAFVQLLDPSGQLISQSDSYPAAGRFPTSQLPAGYVLRDVHPLVIPDAANGSAYQLIAGMYELATLQRLALRQDGSPGPSDHATLGLVQLPAAP
jgi:hypothetical protein